MIDPRVYYPTTTATAILAEAFPGKTVVADTTDIKILDERSVTFDGQPVVVFLIVQSFPADYIMIDDVQHVKIDPGNKKKPCNCSQCIAGRPCSGCNLCVQLE